MYTVGPRLIMDADLALHNTTEYISFYILDDATKSHQKLIIPKESPTEGNLSNTTNLEKLGTLYILEEKAIGQHLGSVWSELPFPSRSDIVQQIISIERKLASVTFPWHGCIYYQSDLESRPERPAFASIQN
ncbi:hypothetical protein BJX76DRAFT_164727 [Aspergillus varians]